MDYELKIVGAAIVGGFGRRERAGDRNRAAHVSPSRGPGSSDRRIA